MAEEYIETAGVVVEGTALGLMAPIGAPILVLNEARKILVGAPDASYKKLTDTATVTATVGGVGLAGAVFAAVCGGPLIVGGIMAAGMFSIVACVKSGLSELSDKQNVAAAPNSDLDNEWVEVQSIPKKQYPPLGNGLFDAD